MNKVILMGRLTHDPEIRYSQGEKQMAIARFSVAVNRRAKQQEGQATADFISCVAFDRLGEFAEKFLRQGTKILLEGRIQTGSYTNREGQKIYTTEVVAESIEFAESKAAEEEAKNKAEKERSKQGKAPSADPNGFMNIPDGVEDEGLPFN